MGNLKFAAQQAPRSMGLQRMFWPNGLRCEAKWARSATKWAPQERQRRIRLRCECRVARPVLAPVQYVDRYGRKEGVFARMGPENGPVQAVRGKLDSYLDSVGVVSASCLAFRADFRAEEARMRRMGPLTTAKVFMSSFRVSGEKEG